MVRIRLIDVNFRGHPRGSIVSVTQPEKHYLIDMCGLAEVAAIKHKPHTDDIDIPSQEKAASRKGSRPSSKKKSPDKTDNN